MRLEVFIHSKGSVRNCRRRLLQEMHSIFWITFFRSEFTVKIKTLKLKLYRGKGKAYGLELMLTKRGEVNGWLSYTYAKFATNAR